MQELLSIEIRRGAPTRLKVLGEVDYTTGRMLTDAIASLDGEDLLIDCDGLTSLDSYGIDVLAVTYLDYEARGRSVLLENLTREVRRTLEVCGLLGADGGWSMAADEIADEIAEDDSAA